MKKLFIGFLCAGIANLQAMHEVGRGMHDINDPFSTLPSHFSDQGSRSFHEIARDQGSRPKTIDKDGTTRTSGTTGKPDPKTDAPKAPQPSVKPVAGEPGVARSGGDGAVVAGSGDGSRVAKSVIDAADGDRTIGGSAKSQPKPRTLLQSFKRFLDVTCGFGSDAAKVEHLSLDARLAETPEAKQQYVNKINAIFDNIKEKFNRNILVAVKNAGKVSQGCIDVMTYMNDHQYGELRDIRETVQEIKVSIDSDPMEQLQELKTKMTEYQTCFENIQTTYEKIISILKTDANFQRTLKHNTRIYDSQVVDQMFLKILSGQKLSMAKMARDLNIVDVNANALMELIRNTIKEALETNPLIQELKAADTTANKQKITKLINLLKENESFNQKEYGVGDIEAIILAMQSGQEKELENLYKTIGEKIKSSGQTVVAFRSSAINLGRTRVKSIQTEIDAALAHNSQAQTLLTQIFTEDPLMTQHVCDGLLEQVVKFGKE